MSCPIAIKEIINLGKALRTGKTKISEVTNEIESEETNLKIERFQKIRVLHLINKIRKEKIKKIQLLQKKLRGMKRKSSKKKFEETSLRNKLKS